MSCCSPQVDDSLTVILTLLQCGTTTPLDISNQTAMEIVLLGPGSNRLTAVAAFVTDGTDGKMTANFASGQLNPAGDWKVQGNVTLPGSVIYHTEVKTFEVNANI